MFNIKKISLVLILITIFTFVFSTITLANNEENISLKIFQYEEKKKSSWGAVGIAWLLPSAGHAYSGDWNRGLKFLAVEGLEVAIMLYAFSAEQGEYYSTKNGGGYNYETRNPALGSMALIALVGTRIWEYIDAYDTAEDYNQELRNSMGLSPKFSFNKDKIQLSLVYDF